MKNTIIFLFLLFPLFAFSQSNSPGVGVTNRVTQVGDTTDIEYSQLSLAVQDSIQQDTSGFFLNDSTFVRQEGGLNIDTVVVRPGTGGGGGVTEFTGLTDAPASYTGQANKMVLVNSGETALIFADTAGLGGGGGSSEWTEASGNLTPTDNEKVSIGVASQYDANTVLTIKDNSTTNLNGVVITDGNDVGKFFFRAGNGRLGINRSNPSNPLDVQGGAIFRNDAATEYTFVNGDTYQIYGSQPTISFQSTDQSPFQQIDLVYNASSNTFDFKPSPVSTRGEDTYYRFLNETTGVFVSIDGINEGIAIGNPIATEDIDIDDNILLRGANDGSATGKVIFNEASNSATQFISLRAPFTLTQNVEYTLPKKGTTGQVLKLGASDSLYWDNVISGLWTDDTDGTISRSSRVDVLDTLAVQRDAGFQIGATGDTPTGVMKYELSSNYLKGYGTADWNIGSETNGIAFHVDNNNRNIGIRTAIPSEALEVNGNAKADSVFIDEINVQRLGTDANGKIVAKEFWSNQIVQNSNSPYTGTESITDYQINGASGAVTLEIPQGTNMRGRVIYLFRTDDNPLETITINTASGAIRGSADVGAEIANRYSSVTLRSNGTDWWVTAINNN